MMKRIPSTSIMLALTSVVLLVLFGSVGFVLLVSLEAETKWVVYIFAAMIAATIFVAIRDKEFWLWVFFVFSFQISVYLRVMYGRAGSGGFMISLTMLAGLALIAWYLAPSTMPRIRSVNWGGPLAGPILFILTVSMLSLVASHEQFISAAQLFVYLQFYALFLLGLNAVITRERLVQTVNVLVAILVIQSVVYYIQSGLGITFTLTGEVIDATGRSSELARPGGTVSTNPAGYASFILPLIFLAAGFKLYAPQRLRGLLYYGIPVLLGIGAIILTITRAAWGSLTLGMIFLVGLGWRRGRISSGSVIVIGIIGFIVAAAATPIMLARMEDAPIEGSYDERFALMRMAFEVIKAEPFLGVGPGAYRDSVTAYLTPELLYYWKEIVHNHYLLRTAEIGILGGIAFVVLMIRALLQSLRVSRLNDPVLQAFGVGMSAALVALFFEMFWDIWGGYSYNALLWFLLGLTGAAESIYASENQASRVPGTSGPAPTVLHPKLQEVALVDRSY